VLSGALTVEDPNEGAEGNADARGDRVAAILGDRVAVILGRPADL